MANNFKAFDTGIRISPGLAADPVSGKVGEIYWNTVKSGLRICTSSSPLVWEDVGATSGTVNNSTLRWDTATDSWVENTTVQTTTDQLMGLTQATANTFTVKAGDNTGGVTGGALQLKGGDVALGTAVGGAVHLIGGKNAPGTLRGSILINSPIVSAYDGTTGNSIVFKAGNSSNAGIDGGKLTIQGGNGGLGAYKGDIELNNCKKVILSPSESIRINAQFDFDPTGTPQIGDLYYNYGVNKLRFSKGSTALDWEIVGKPGLIVIDLYDNVHTNPPATTATQIDSVTVTDGMIVMFDQVYLGGNYDNGYYIAKVSGINITWVIYPIGQNNDIAGSGGGGNLFIEGDKVFVKFGTIHSRKEMYYDGASWLENIAKGTVTNSTLYWNGSRWIENITVKTGTDQIFGRDNSVADANPASNFILRAANKTAGTGNGGDLSLKAGTSVGGQKGAVKIEGYKLNLNLQLAADPVIDNTLGDIYYNTVTKRFRYYDGTSWQDLGSGTGVFKVRLYNPISAVLPTGDPVTIDGVTVLPDDLVLFTNLSSGNNQVYKAVGTGTNITSWTVQLAFGGLSSPTDGDLVIVQSGTLFADQIGKFNGINWVYNDKVKYFNGVNYWEESNLNTVTINDNQIIAADIFSVAYAGSENILIDYSIKRGTVKEIGTIFISTDGTDVSLATSGADIGDSGVTFSSIISGSDIKLQYISTNTGSSGEMKFSVKRWSDTAGGPSGFPSYPGGLSNISGSGANKQIAFWNGTNTLTGNSNFTYDSAGLFFTLGAAEQTILDNDSISSGTFNNALLFTYPTTHRFVIVDYSVTRGTTYRVGSLHIIHDGTSVNVTDTYSDIGDTNMEFASPLVTHTISGGNVEIRCNSVGAGGVAGTFSKVMLRWA